MVINFIGIKNLKFNFELNWENNIRDLEIFILIDFLKIFCIPTLSEEIRDNVNNMLVKVSKAAFMRISMLICTAK